MLRGLILGIALGVIAGWLIWGESRDSPAGDPTLEAGTPADVEAPPAPALSVGATAPASSATPSNAEEKPAPPDRSRVFRSNSRAELSAAFTAHPDLSDAEVMALIDRLEDARREKDLWLFRLLLQVLGGSGHPAAHAHLVALAADVEAELPAEFTKIVPPFLLTTKAPGVVAAAQARIEAERKIGPWVEIVVARGSPADIDEILDRSDHHVQATGAYAQLMRRPLLEARAYLARAVAQGPPRVNLSNVLDAFVSAHPNEAREMMAAGIQAFDAGAKKWKGLNSWWMPVHWYLRTVRAQDWPEAARLLGGLRDERMRLAAIQTLGIYGHRGFDMAPLTELLELPGRTIRELVVASPLPADAGERVQRLFRMLDGTGPTLLEKNVAALEYAAAAWQGEHRDEFQRIAKRARAALESDDWR